MKSFYQEEQGKAAINGHKFEWKMKRTKGESAFGIKGSRIFGLEIKKDGFITGAYDRGWSVRIRDDDADTKLCLDHILNTYGKEKKKVKKDAD